MKLTPLTPAFFEKSTITVAKKLLGTLLVHESAEGTTIGRIVETEAYLKNDPACHASRGQTPRNTPMFGQPGLAYIYFIYGMYECFNVVTAPEGVGEAVLIRALEPVDGIDLMSRRRAAHKKSGGVPSLHQLCNGPGKLCIAMGLMRELNRINLMTSHLKICEGDRKKESIVTTTRIGIREGAELPLRFYLKGNGCVSRL